MKKQRLTINKETARILTGDELAFFVRGGEDWPQTSTSNTQVFNGCQTDTRTFAPRSAWPCAPISNLCTAP